MVDYVMTLSEDIRITKLEGFQEVGNWYINDISKDDIVAVHGISRIVIAVPYSAVLQDWKDKGWIVVTDRPLMLGGE